MAKLKWLAGLSVCLFQKYCDLLRILHARRIKIGIAHQTKTKTKSKREQCSVGDREFSWALVTKDTTTPKIPFKFCAVKLFGGSSSIRAAH